MKLVIVGFGPAGFAAALYARKQNPDAEICVIDEKDYLAHSCYLPFALDGTIKLEDTKHDPMLGKMRIEHITFARVTKIDKENKKVELTKDGGTKSVSYDKLLISTGSKAFKPRIEGIENAFGLYSFQDAEAVSKKIKEFESAVVIGAGAIGIETAFALKKAGLKVTIAEAFGSVMQQSFDNELSSLLEDEIRKNGIDLLLNSKVQKIVGKKIILENSEIETDMVVLAVGVRPNIELAQDVVEIENGNISVNELMQTSDPDIYAAGDCCHAFNFITKKPCNAKLSTIAYLQGMVAGVNAVGGNRKYIGTLGTFVSRIDRYEVASTGITEGEAKKLGMEIITSKINAFAIPEPFPENNKIMLKLVAEKGSGRILGAQGYGFGATNRINLIAQAIYSNAKLTDMLDYENAYCPSVSKTYDLLKVGVEMAIRKNTRL
ncbi:MAG: FAD-dependent oxidoreductase [Candidatus Micrarchaeota archaeon]